MICTQVKNYVILISQLTFSQLATTNSSVLCFIGSNNGGIYIFVFICTMKYLNFKLRQENTFILSEKMCVVIVQDSKNFITHHSFSFSCQAVRLLLILLIAFFFFWMCGNDQNRFQQNVFKPNFGRGARIFISKWTRHASEKCYCVLGHESHSNTVRLGMFLSFPIYSNLRAKRCRNYFLPLGKVFDWFLVLELEVNYSAYHEHVCIFAYIHM